MAKSKNKKQVKTSVPIPATTQKLPKAVAQQNFNQLKPAWRVSLLEMCDPYGWHEIEEGKLIEIHSKLRELEALTWNDILVIRKHWNHRILRGDICKDARDRLKELRLDDLEELISFRLSGGERVWGFEYADACTLLWWDPEHQVYTYELPHT
jgi:hypothetical protein